MTEGGILPVHVELDGANIAIQAEWRLKEICRALPGSKWDAEKNVWRIPVSWTGCLALRQTFGEELTIGSELANWARNEKANRIDPSNALRDIEATEEGDQDLFPHQRAGVDWMVKARRGLLADEPGLGKTAQAIRALKRLQEKEEVFPALIVCPNTLKTNWAREFDKWWPGVNVQVIKGTPAQRRKAFETKADVYVINWESLRTHSRLSPYGSIALARCTDCGGHDPKITIARCEVHPRELNAINFKAVVADEIHRSKDPKSKQTRALWSASGDADIRYALTGTPIANDVVDLWAILHWLDNKEWPSKTKWIDRYVNSFPNVFGALVVLGLKPAMEAEFYAGINPRMRRMLKTKVLPWLPEVINDRRDVEMGTKQAKAYKQMLENMMALLDSSEGSAFGEFEPEQDMLDGEVIVASNPMVQAGRLVQFSSAYGQIELTEEGEKMILSDPSCKVDALMEDIKNGDFGEDSVAVCAVSRQLIELLSARMTKEKIPHGLITGAQDEFERQQAIDNFQSGRIKWILFTAQAGGVGVTLTAARRLVMLQRPWSLVDYKQAIDRVHRIGSEIHDSIIITDYVTEGTIEEKVIETLGAKDYNFQQIVRDKEQLMKVLEES